MAEILPLTRSPQERLQAALRLLAAAQEEQRAAVNAFRENLYVLRDTTAKLQDSVHGWNRAVAATGKDLEKAREAVQTLARTAAAM